MFASFISIHSVARKVTAYLLSIFFIGSSFAQLSPADQKLMDSLIKHDDFFKMLNELDNPRSVLRVNVGIGNMLYSGANKAVQNLEVNPNLIYTPSLSYIHKSGFGITASSSLTKIGEQYTLYQASLSPSFTYSKGNFADAALAYVHYFKIGSHNSTSSLLDNEVYGTVLFKKLWLMPRLSVSYSEGGFTETTDIDTTVRERNRLVRLKYIDTSVTRISSLSFSAGVEHDFLAYKLLFKNDGLRFTPQLSGFMGVNNYSVDYNATTQLYNLRNLKKFKKLKKFQSSSQVNGKFELQSVGLDLDFTYTIGKFYIEPDIYLDYYVPESSDNPFSQIYNFNIGITF